MQRIGNLVDLEKCCKMSIWLQNFASLQPRTSPVKFDHLAEKSEKDTVSNLVPRSERSVAGGPGRGKGGTKGKGKFHATCVSTPLMEPAILGPA